MKIYTAKQIRKADAFTIKNEPISSIDLMERAATSAFNWIRKKYKKESIFSVFCGVGNNGGDGLVIARLLYQSGYSVHVYEVQFSSNPSKDYLQNKERLNDLKIPVINLYSKSDYTQIQYGNVIVDAIFGSGLSREVDGWIGDLIVEINRQLVPTVSIDIASGLFPENNDTNTGAIIKPNYTLSFEFPKLAFMFPSNYPYVGEFVIIPIGISEVFVVSEPSNNFFIETFLIDLVHRIPKKFDYKGTYGHALIMAGSYGKMGAAVLAAKACLKSGAGLVTAHVPKGGNEILQIAVPEVMTWMDKHLGYLTELKKVTNFTSIGVGPGLGKMPETHKLVRKLLDVYKRPMVLDADALNILADNKEWLFKIPRHSILTPHLGEWKRLIGETAGDFNQLEKAKIFTSMYDVYVILKGAHTAVVCPNGEVFFNSTGNPGMATAGSGDVLTGILTGLLAQGYRPVHAAILGVYIHGFAGDLALKKGSRESVVASVIIAKLGKAFSKITSSKTKKNKA